jgi:hypothetical protein
MLLASPRLVAEACHAQWRKAPWSIPPAHVRAAMPRTFALATVEGLLGYRFFNPLLLVWALTHSSYQHVWTSDAPNPWP